MEEETKVDSGEETKKETVLKIPLPNNIEWLNSAVDYYTDADTTVKYGILFVLIILINRIFSLLFRSLFFSSGY